ATVLKHGGEKCWQCGAELEVPDTLPATATTAPATTAPATTATKQVPAAGAARSFMMKNMERVNQAMNSIGMPHELKVKYLKEMASLNDADQVRFLMELEKMAYPENITPDEVSPVTQELEEKLMKVSMMDVDPTTISDKDVSTFLKKGFTTLDPVIINAINQLPWSREKKLGLAKEILTLSPEERAELLKEMLSEPEKDDE
ncbi:MAG: hypothetical protein ACTSUE_02930, partial [Promethearchaeota archaeon]